jgi:hypothetical protein
LTKGPLLMRKILYLLAFTFQERPASGIWKLWINQGQDSWIQRQKMTTAAVHIAEKSV